MRQTGTWKAADEERDERDGKGKERGGMGKEATLMALMVDKLVAVAWQQWPYMVRVSSHTKRSCMILRAVHPQQCGTGLVSTHF